MIFGLTFGPIRCYSDQSIASIARFAVFVAYNSDNRINNFMGVFGQIVDSLFGARFHFLGLVGQTLH